MSLEINLIIFDSDKNKHLLKGEQGVLNALIYDPRLWIIAETPEEKKQEVSFIKHLQKKLQHGSFENIKQPGVISMGTKKQAGGLVIDKLTQSVFWYKKSNQFLFSWFPKHLKDFYNSKNNKKNLDFCFNGKWNNIKVYKPMGFNSFCEVKTESLNSIKQTIKTLEYLREPLVYVQIPIDLKGLGFKLKVYENNYDEFRQMAIDLINNDIHLNEREQQIWCNKLMSLVPQISKDEKKIKSEDFYNTLNIKIQYDKLKEKFITNHETESVGYQVKKRGAVL